MTVNLYNVLPTRDPVVRSCVSAAALAFVWAITGFPSAPLAAQSSPWSLSAVAYVGSSERTNAGESGTFVTFPSGEDRGLATRFGVDVEHRLTDRLSVVTGLRYLTLRVRAERALRFGDAFSGGVFTGEASTLEQSFASSFVEVPALAKWYFGRAEARTRAFASAGPAVSVYVRTEESTELDGEEIASVSERLGGLREVQIGAHAGFGVQSSFGSRITTTGQIGLAYQLTADAPRSDSHWIDYGLLLGVGLRL